MKKAYVKPVFFAEEFETMTYYCSDCLHHTDSTNINSTLDLGPYYGVKGATKEEHVCSNGIDGHFVGGNNSALDENYKTLWADYAMVDGQAALFDRSNNTCDFVWMQPSGEGDEIRLWMTSESDNTLVTGSAVEGGWDYSARDSAHLGLFAKDQWVSFMSFFTGCNAGGGHGLNYEAFNMKS